MTPEKALEILKIEQARSPRCWELNSFKARQLGLEALELCISFRHDDPTNAAFDLPSEDPQ